MAKFHVAFNENRCKACGLCVMACPKHLIVIRTDAPNESGYNPAAITDEEACVGCLSCARMCPDCIITITRND